MTFTESLDELVADDKSGLLGVHPTWTRVRLADVCAILNGFPFSSKQFKGEGGTPLIRIRDVIRGRTSTHFVGEYDATFIVRHGELVVGMDGDFNCALWSGGDALLNQRVCKLTPDERHYDLRLLAHVLPGYLSAINSKTSAITVKHLSSKTVADIPLPLPPRQEQTRIASAIESYFTRLDDAVATLERVQRNLKRYRASVLMAAVEGRLVPTEAEVARAEGRSYEPASVLLERILTERRRRWEEVELEKMKAKGEAPKDDRWKAKYVEPVAPDTSELPELAEGWAWTTLDCVATVKGGITKGQKPKKDEPYRAVPYLRVANVQRGFLDLSEVKSIEASEAQIEELRLEPGDVLFNEGGDRDKLGRGWIWRAELPECIHQNHVFRARLLTDDLLPELLSWYGNTAGQKYFFDEGKHTTNLASINMTNLRGLPVPVPPPAEQQRIRESVEAHVSVIDALLRVMSGEVMRVTRLRQSVLKWAFEGRLVDQNPTDEPASVLLERIRTERPSAKFIRSRSPSLACTSKS